jgi:Protein of unknown function (DUF1566)
MSVSWDRRIDKAQRRFKLLNEFNTEAVLDKETGLVWERSPNKNVVAWPNARLMCAQKGVGGRGGWRLPTFNELASLVDPAITDPTIPRLPAGHPFLDVQAASYWSATAFADEPGFALMVNFMFVAGSDAPIGVNDANTKGGQYHVWAVRGGSPGPGSY